MTTPSIPLPLPVTPPDVVSGFDELIARLRSALTRLERDVDRVMRGAERALRLLPASLARGLSAACERLRHIWEQAGQQMQRLWDAFGSPKRVWAAGADWVERYSEPVSRIIGGLGSDRMDADQLWDGSASRAYAATIARQKEAVAALQGIGADLNTALGSVAVAICALWAAVLAAVLAACVELAAAGVAAGSVVFSEGALVFAVGAVSAMLTGLSVGIGAFMLVVERANDALTGLQRRLHDSSGFAPDDSTHTVWPAPRTDRFRDGVAWEMPA